MSKVRDFTVTSDIILYPLLSFQSGEKTMEVETEEKEDEDEEESV